MKKSELKQQIETLEAEKSALYRVIAELKVDIVLLKTKIEVLCMPEGGYEPGSGIDIDQVVASI